MNIIFAKKIDLNGNLVEITFEDGTKSNVSTTDGVKRMYSKEYKIFKLKGGITAPFESQVDKKNRKTKEGKEKVSNDILFHYPANKQREDAIRQSYSTSFIVFKSNSTTDIITHDSLVFDIMGISLSVYNKFKDTSDYKDLDISDFLLIKNVEVKEHYEKLVKICVRHTWLIECSNIGKNTTTDKGVLIYPKFPDFNKG